MNDPVSMVTVGGTSIGSLASSRMNVPLPSVPGKSIAQARAAATVTIAVNTMTTPMRRRRLVSCRGQTIVRISTHSRLRRRRRVGPAATAHNNGSRCSRRYLPDNDPDIQSFLKIPAEVDGG